VLAVVALVGAPVLAWGTPPAWTTQDLLTTLTPYALGHRGYGEFSPQYAENTLPAFHHAFMDGIRVVELDLQMTADGQVVVYHNDALPDGRCISSITYGDLLVVEPNVPMFRSVLNSDRHFGFDCALSGLVFAEIKAPIPFCSDDTTSAMAAATEGPLVAAVVRDIRQARMEDQVIINSGSPSILRQALVQAPEIRRALSLNVLQLLDPATISDRTGYRPVHRIPKDDCGLDWYDVSTVARLPTFYPSESSHPNPIARFIGTAVVCNGAKWASVDKLVFFSNTPAAPSIIDGMHQAGLDVIAWTVDTAPEFDQLAAWGVDGITTNNIEMGLEHQADLVPCEPGVRKGAADVLALAPTTSALGTPRETGSSVRVAFRLPDDGAARLDLLDIAGRRLDSREVGAFGMGAHETNLGHGLRPGIYFVRLSHAQESVRAKVAITH
jgi:glycerophosphoryl diester phosphodiesterase